MGFKCGIVGLPNVGKSTLFNALTKTAAAQAANYPFCTIEPNTGEVAVPDPRMDIIAKIGDDTACVVVQSPSFYGQLPDIRKIADAAHAKGALLRSFGVCP